ncbi:hypothetical protein [Scytonema sp. UIC 10036]|nr:hypothetical protein [Scytonema sp. UIC 10036]
MSDDLTRVQTRTPVKICEALRKLFGLPNVYINNGRGRLPYRNP